MLKVAQLLKHLSNHAFHMSPVRLTFANYLQNCHEPDEQVNEELIQGFLFECLEYPHWCQQKNQLTQDLKDALSSVLDETKEELDLASIKWSNEIQTVEIDNLNDLAECVNSYLEAECKQGEKFRIMFDPVNKKMVALILDTAGALRVATYDKKFLVRKGRLEPLRKNLGLYYDAQFELTAGETQRLEVAPYITARFKLTKGEYRGIFVRGYIFQKFHELRGDPMAAYPKLFYAIKRLENLFLKKESNTFYLQLTSDLERQIQLVRLGDQEAIQNSTKLVTKAQHCLEYVFVGDKLLNLLLRDLQHTLGSEKWQSPLKIEFALTN